MFKKGIYKKKTHTKNSKTEQKQHLTVMFSRIKMRKKADLLSYSVKGLKETQLNMLN